MPNNVLSVVCMCECLPLRMPRVFSSLFNLTIQLEHLHVQEIQQCNDSNRVVTKKEGCPLVDSF